MMEYLALAVVTSVLVALGGIIAYGDDGARAARAAMGIILLCTVSVPAVRVALTLGDIDVGEFFEDVGAVGGSSLGNIAEAPFEEGVKKMLREEFALEETDVDVHVFGLDTSSMRAEKIVVVLRGKGALSDLRGIRFLVEDAGLGNCEVKIEAS